MYSGIKERINNYKKLSEKEKNELKQLYKVFGRDIQDRWKKTQELYSQFNCNAIFKTYNSNHGYTDEIEHDIISFLNDNKKTHRLR